MFLLYLANVSLFVSFFVYYFSFCIVLSVPNITIFPSLGAGCVSDVSVPLYVKIPALRGLSLSAAGSVHHSTQHTAHITHNTHSTQHTQHTQHTAHTTHTAHSTHNTHSTQHTQHTQHTAHNTQHTQHTAHSTQHKAHSTQHTAHSTHSTQHIQHTAHTHSYIKLTLSKTSTGSFIFYVNFYCLCEENLTGQ